MCRHPALADEGSQRLAFAVEDGKGQTRVVSALERPHKCASFGSAMGIVPSRRGRGSLHVLGATGARET
jgi:hypothetical protein